MSVIDQLRPYVSLCQACGFIPYVMERDSKTKRFVKFNFSWKYSITWWFIGLACSQLAFPLIMNQISAIMSGKSNGKEETPVTVRILMVVTFFCYVIQMIIALWIVLLQHVRLQNIVKLALRVELLLQTTNNHPSHQISSFIHRRLILICQVFKKPVNIFYNPYQCPCFYDVLNSVLTITKINCERKSLEKYKSKEKIQLKCCAIFQLYHGRINSIVFDPTLVDSTSHFNVSTVSPCRSPGVTDNPVINTIQSSIADNYHSMSGFCVTVGFVGVNARP